MEAENRMSPDLVTTEALPHEPHVGPEDEGPRRPVVPTDLAERPWAYDFYQAMRVLEQANPGLPRWGESSTPAQDPIRLAQEPSLEFARSALSALVPATDRDAARLLVRFFGLFGPNGPLPLHLTEYACDRTVDKQGVFARFADVFHHRMLALFYRGWAAAEPAIQQDRPDQDRFARQLGALFGWEPGQSSDEEVVPPTALLHFAGVLVGNSRGALGLESIVGGFFECQARVESFAGQWLSLPEGTQCELGGSAECAALGRTTTLGDHVWDRQQKFRVVLGPLGLATYERLLPDAAGSSRLASLVHAYVGDELTWECLLVVRRDEVPETRLGAAGRLGWTSWLRTLPAENHAADMVLDGSRLIERLRNGRNPSFDTFTGGSNRG